MGSKGTLFTIHIKTDGVPQADALVLLLKQEDMAHLGWSGNAALDETIRQLCSRQIFSGEKNEVQVVPTHGLISYNYLVLVGLGKTSDTAGSAETIHTVREAAVYAARAALKNQIQSIAVCFQEEVEGASWQKKADPAVAETVYCALTEGILLGSYRIKSYQRDAKEQAELRHVTYLVKNGGPMMKSIEHGIEIGEACAEATHYARDLTNLPGNYLVPTTLAEEAVKLSKTFGFACEILDETEIVARGMGGLYEVGKGSVHPPRMIVLKYQGLDEWKDVLGIVGKGITFDTGGISLKKGDGMEEMISDMGGAATILGVMQAVGKLRPKANLVTVIPAAENMPSGAAFKPGDIVTTLSGRTIEVLNTDAEGRMVLADGVTYAKQLGACRVIDVATLTGAVLVSLGDVATAAVTNDDAFLRQLLDASKAAGEKIWQLPAYPEYWDMLKSTVADITNAPGKWAAAITAGLFVGVFAEETPWIHLDTGGTAWLWNEKGIEPKGGTGAMVRTIIELIRSQP